MPAVIFIFMVGIAVGYWLCRMQLRGKFLLAEEEMDRAVSARLNAEWMATHPPWPPPTQPQPTHTQELPPGLVSDNTPHGFSAKQVIGYDDFGYKHESQYPGGIRSWDANVNGIYHEEEEK